MSRTVRIFRYDTSQPDGGRFDTFQLEIPSETTTTILDVLLRIQQEQDPTLAFRFACRVNMCGSCGMVIDGREGLACKTNVSEIAPGKEITVRPLNHFPVIKDLVVDMEPFFRKYDAVMPFFQPKEGADEPARIAPDSAERLAIASATECIACGCCVSSCTMVADHSGYAGPAALNRAFTLIADSRDALRAERLEHALASCYNCRTELNCTEVCPKGISPSRAIKYIQREAVIQRPASTRGWKAWLPVIMATAVSCVALLLYVTLTRLASAHADAEPVPVPARTLTASESHGLSLYSILGCSGCHQIDGHAGHRVGPDLANMAVKKRTREDLVHFIRNPGVDGMPPYELPDTDLRALADFVLAVGQPPLKTIPREEILKHE
jgi:succinate dehydrogenase/fumarate reductase iron-sulfur protein